MLLFWSVAKYITTVEPQGKRLPLWMLLVSVRSPQLSVTTGDCHVTMAPPLATDPCTVTLGGQFRKTGLTLSKTVTVKAQLRVLLQASAAVRVQSVTPTLKN